MPAARQDGSRPARANAWLITGEFVRVNGGSRELRGLVGLGLGGTKMETLVRVYDLSRLSKEPVLQFETSGGSNAEPGALVGGMFGALPNALRNAGARGFMPHLKPYWILAAWPISALLFLVYCLIWLPDHACWPAWSGTTQKRFGS